MQQLRRSLLSILLMFAVGTTVMGSAGVSNAASRPFSSEPASPPYVPPPANPDPNTGEPDSGSTRPISSTPHARFSTGGGAQFSIRTIRVVGWTSLIWMKRAIGIGF